MNVFNRLVIILLILVAMLAIPLALIFPEQAENVLRYMADVIRANLAWLSTLPATTQMGVRVLLIVCGGIVFLISLLFLILEVVRFRRKTVRLKNGSGELMMDGIAGHLAYHVDLLADVARVRPEVVSKGKSVEVSLYVETAPEVSIPAKAAEVKETVRKVVEEQLGLQLKGEVKVVVKPVSYPKPSPVRSGSQARRRPKQPAMPAPQGEPPVAERVPSEGLEPFEAAPGEETRPEQSERVPREGWQAPLEASEPAHAGGTQTIEVKGPNPRDA